MLVPLAVTSAVRLVFVKVPRFPQKTHSRRPAFDVQLFQDSAGLGRKVNKFRAKETVFAQGNSAKRDSHECLIPYQVP
jgi:hypothetical protein